MVIRKKSGGNRSQLRWAAKVSMKGWIFSKLTWVHRTFQQEILVVFHPKVPQQFGSKAAAWWLDHTPLKMNGWNIIMEVDGSDQFPFQMGDGCRFQPLIFQGVLRCWMLFFRLSLDSELSLHPHFDEELHGLGGVFFGVCMDYRAPEDSVSEMCVFRSWWFDTLRLLAATSVSQEHLDCDIDCFPFWEWMLC